MPAPKGNTNALKHGFYAKQFSADEAARLDDQKPADVQAEIALLRICIDRLSKELDFAESNLKDPFGNSIRDEHYLKQLNTLSLITQSLATLARTQHMIAGKNAPVNDAILQALEEIRLEMGL